MCVLQVDAQSGCHARSARGGERVSVLGPRRLGSGVPAGNPRPGGSQCGAATW